MARYVWSSRNQSKGLHKVGEAHSLPLAKQLAEEAHDEVGYHGTVTTISRERTTDMWFYRPARRSGHMTWEKR